MRNETAFEAHLAPDIRGELLGILTTELALGPRRLGTAAAGSPTVWGARQSLGELGPEAAT